MDIIISTTDDGSILEVLKDGTIIISRDNPIDIYVGDLKYRFLFIEPSEDGKQVTTEFINDGKESERMQLTIQVEKNELKSVFCPPVKIGTFVQDNISNGIYLSFNVRSLDGNSNHCLMFSYTLFKSR